MTDNFHASDCALRRNGNACTCGYVKPLSKLERELAELRAAYGIALAANNELRAELSEARKAMKETTCFFHHDALTEWLDKHPD